MRFSLYIYLNLSPKPPTHTYTYWQYNNQSYRTTTGTKLCLWVKITINIIVYNISFKSISTELCKMSLDYS